MTWYALCHRETGRLESVADVVSSQLPDHLEKLELAGQPDFGGQMWDEATKAFIPRPAKVLVDRLADLASHPEFAEIWQALNVAQRAKLRSVLIYLLGRARWRPAGETVEL